MNHMKRGEFMYYNQNLPYNIFLNNINGNINNMYSCACTKSYFRVLNAVEGYPAVDVYVNEMLLSSNLKYSEFSRYMKFMPGSYKLTVYPSGSKKEPILETSIKIGENLAYTGVLSGNIKDLSDLSIYMMPDKKEKQAMDNMSAVKVINLINNSVPLELLTGDGTILFSDLEYADITNNVALPSGTYTLHLRPKGSDKNILIVPSVDFAPRMYYTLYLIGEYGEDKIKIEMLIPEDGINYLDLC